MKIIKRLLLIAAALAVLVVYVLWANTHCGVTRYEVKGAVPREFSGFRILQVSDLHDALIGRDNADIIKLAEKADPDIIVITGDVIDSNRVNIERSLSVCRRLSAIAPVYYVTGNHEAALPNRTYRQLKSGLMDAGIEVLEDRSVYLSRGNARIQIAGLTDIGFYHASSVSVDLTETYERASNIIDPNVYTVLLSHRPELIKTYRRLGVDLVLAGHAHGGQVRLPFIGGLYSPGQGMLPEYDCGLYEFDSLTMEVSRGIGNSKFPLRINNNPELVLITLVNG